MAREGDMAVMALDIGEKRTGVAVSDASGAVALPLAVVPTNELMQGAPRFKGWLADYEVEQLVVGLPVSLNGTEQAQAERVREQAAGLAQRFGLPVAFIDERLSSTEARRILRQLGYHERDMRGKTDKIAASLFLQTWLDTQKALVES